MAIQLSEQTRQEAIASIKRYMAENLEVEAGNIAALGLLDYFLKEIAPAVYNQAVRDAQERLQLRVMELDVDLQQAEFCYWRR